MEDEASIVPLVAGIRREVQVLIAEVRNILLNFIFLLNMFSKFVKLIKKILMNLNY